MLPDVNTTKYCVLAKRLLVGSMVSVEPDRVRRLLVAASKLSTMAPVAEPERRVIVPVPRAIASEKVSTMLAPTVTPVAPSAGEKVRTVGAVVSEISRDRFEKTSNSILVRVSVPSVPTLSVTR